MSEKELNTMEGDAAPSQRTGDEVVADGGGARDGTDVSARESADWEPVEGMDLTASLDLPALKSKAAKAEENWGLYLRTRADLENYRKRATRERQEAARYACLPLIERLLPVLDGFDMALAAFNQGGQTQMDSMVQGVLLVHGQLKAVLAEVGAQEIDAAGAVFDPAIHEAVAHQESADVPEGHVLQQVRKGYRLHDRLVRPASVVVAKKPAG
jgi:molecular chaperone GrpE